MKNVSVFFRSHPSEEVWELYAQNRLPKDQLALAETHLLACPQCQDALDTLDNLVLLKSSGAGKEYAPKEGVLARLRRTFWPAGLAARVAWAAVAAALLVAAYLTVRTSTSPVAAVVVTLRGQGDEVKVVQVPAGKPLELGIDATNVRQSPQLRVEIVSVAGQQVWAGQPNLINGNLDAIISQGLTTGDYWVRIYNASDLQREYGLRAK